MLVIRYMLVLFLAGHICTSVEKKNVYLKIQDASTGQIIPSTMHGIFLETNINRDDDGGLYAELIYNRAFQGYIYAFEDVCCVKYKI